MTPLLSLLLPSLRRMGIASVPWAALTGWSTTHSLGFEILCLCIYVSPVRVDTVCVQIGLE